MLGLRPPDQQGLTVPTLRASWSTTDGGTWIGLGRVEVPRRRARRCRRTLPTVRPPSQAAGAPQGAAAARRHQRSEDERRSPLLDLPSGRRARGSPRIVRAAEVFGKRDTVKNPPNQVNLAVLITVLVMAFALAGCGGDGGTSTKTMGSPRSKSTSAHYRARHLRRRAVLAELARRDRAWMREAGEIAERCRRTHEHCELP